MELILMPEHMMECRFMLGLEAHTFGICGILALIQIGALRYLPK
jgi:hypothetical protein